MDAADKRMLEREALRTMIQQWNANRLDLFELSEPNENLEFHGVMRFYFQDSGQKIATKCIRVASDATVSDVIETLIEKFRPDMRMLSLGSYSLWETHGPDDERKLEPHEKPLLVQLNWHTEDREGRFLLKCLTNNEMPLSVVNEKADQNFKRKLSKREKKELKKKEKLSRLKSDTNDENRPVAEKLYTELPETSFTRSISNPEAVMRRRRQQKLERKLQQFRSKDGGPDTGGTLKIYGSSLCPDVPYKTLLLSVGDNASSVVREMLDKYGLSRHDPQQYCIVQVDTTDNSEYILDDDDCPLAIVMTHHHHSSIMFHVRRRPADAQPRRRKKKAGGSIGSGGRPGTEPALLEVAPDGTALENGRRLRITEVVEVGSGNGTALQLYGPSIQPRHCVIAPADGGGHTVTPLHADAHVYLNGRRVTNTQRIQHGSLLKFGRVSTFRFVDPMQENLLNRNLSQSQHFGSGSIYDRSPTSPGNTSAMSPTLDSHGDANANTTDDYTRTMSPVSQDTYYRDDNTSRSYIDDNTRSYRDDDATSRPYIDDNQRPYRDDDPTRPYNNNTLKLDNESLVMSQQTIPTGDDYIVDEQTGSVYNEHDQNATPNRTVNSQYKDNYETTFDLDGNVETKSICSAKSGGSGHDSRISATVPTARPGQEAILPAVLEFPEQGQAQFLAAVITRLDPHAPAFKLAPVYTLYLCARYRASTHYRPELTPTERAHKLTAFLHHVATLIHETVQLRCNDSAAQAFWMANASELLHFLKCDRHISSFSTQAQDLLPTTVQNAFSNLVSCFQEELSRALATLSNPSIADATEATAPTLQTLAAAMVLLRRCRVNAALTIQLFSHLFHYINAVCFNKLVTEPGTISARWGAALSARFALLAAWAERQGLEIAADCHLARTHQAARLIQGEYRTAEEGRAALSACFKLNSVQVRALLSPLAAPEVVDAAVAHARALSDELHRSDGREIRLEEGVWLGTGLLIPGDGFSAEVVRGVPPGLAEFVAPLQRGGLCRLAHQPHALGAWTVYMGGAPGGGVRAPDPRLAIVQLNKSTSGMGLSIVAAKGYGQNKLGIYIKSVVAGGAAAADGRLAAGDQLLSVDGQSLVGITQEKAAEYLMRTGPVVTLEVAKQGAVLHGLATLLHQPTYNPKQAGGTNVPGPGGRRMSERDLPSRLAAEPVKPSKSTPALHAHAPPHLSHSATLSPPQSGPGSPNAWANKSRSSHNLSAPQHDTFYQNLSTVHHQQQILQDRWSSLRSSTGSNRPQSAHFSVTAEQTPEAHIHQQMSARAAKLAEMSEEVNRRMQQQQPYQQKPLPIQPHLPPHHNHQQMVNQTPMQGQMPPTTGYATASQPPLSPPPVHSPLHYHNQSQSQPTMQQQLPQQIQQQMSHQMQHQIPQQMQQQMQQQIHQQMPQQMQQQMPQQIQQQMPQQIQQQMPQQIQQQMPQQMQQQIQSQTQPQLQLQSQRYEWHPPGPPSPQRTQPPVAPKPQNARRSENDLEDSFQVSQQLQSAGMVQPEDERYVASALEPPAVSVYPAAGGPGGARGPPAHNPWQREERERQAEARRMANRARRDATIAQLVSLGAARTSVQNQQLRALQLERDFERRATQHEEDVAAADGCVEDEEEEKEEPLAEAEPRAPLPPKSILKTNPRQELANGYNGYAPEPQQPPVGPPEEARMSELAGSMSSLSTGAPPPPARGSSFAVMAGRARQHEAPQQQQHHLHQQQQQQPPPLAQQAPLSPVSSGRDKRVSFHERAGEPPAPPSSSPPPLEPAQQAAPAQQAREDPDRFIEEAESMLAGGASPGGGAAAAPAHTPGVIGAQEVYRDPRTRRLAEQQARASAAPVPEQLSFREKMKMFALEAGDPATPKDKVKISRAQRDIDAVH